MSTRDDAHIVETEETDGARTWSVRLRLLKRHAVACLVFLICGIIMGVVLYTSDRLDWSSAIWPAFYLWTGLFGLYVSVSFRRTVSFRSRIDGDGISTRNDKMPSGFSVLRFDDIERAEHRVDAYGEAMFIYRKDAPHMAHMLKPPVAPPVGAMADALRKRGIPVSGG